MINRLTSTLDFQTQALTLRAERQRLIASNIANADTPGYVARDFNFAQALQQATGWWPAAASSCPRTPVPGQPDATGGSGKRPGDPRLNYAAPSQTNLDRNSVDMDRERATFAENALKYESTLRFINSSVKTTLDSMKSHNQ